MIIDWPGTYPEDGILICKLIDPWLQQQEKKFFIISSSNPSYSKNRIIVWIRYIYVLRKRQYQYLTHFSRCAFKSKVEITVNAILVWWSNLHGLSITTFIVYLTCPYLCSKLLGMLWGSWKLNGYSWYPKGIVIRELAEKL